jgi:hypothetical protein
LSTEEPREWSGLKSVPGILAPDVKAPLPLPRESPLSYRALLERLVEHLEVPGGTIAAALSAGSGLLEGAQTFVGLANQVIDSRFPPHLIQKGFRGLLLSSLALTRLRAAAYSLLQVAEIARGTLERAGDEPTADPGLPAADSVLQVRWQLPRFSRLKGLMPQLDSAMTRLEVSKEMEVTRYAAFLVHMDDLYDDSSLQLQRLFSLASRDIEEARGMAPEFLRRLYQEFANASLADHIVAEHEEALEPGQRTGLLALLPELIDVLERR